MPVYNVVLVLCLLLGTTLSVAVSSSQPIHLFEKQKTPLLQHKHWPLWLPNRNKLMRAKQAFTKADDDPSWDTNVSDDELRQLLTEAFLGTDTAACEPLLQWMLDTATGFFPLGNKQQWDIVTFLNSMSVLRLRFEKSVAFCKRSGDGELMGCIMVRECNPRKANPINPKGWKKEFVSYINNNWNSDHVQTVYVWEPFYSQRLAALLESFSVQRQQWQDEYGPKNKHWYVTAGVAPQHQGKGVGTQILRRVQDLADQEGVACYLECVGDKNRGFYEKLGYERIASKGLLDVVNDPPKEPCLLHLMMRCPNVTNTRKRQWRLTRTRDETSSS